MNCRLSMIALVLAFANLAAAAEPAKEPAATPKTQSPAELAVRKAASAFDEAFNSGNAENVAGLWAVDA